MSLSGDTTMTMPVAPVGYSGGGYGGGNGMFGGDGVWWIILFLVVFLGWGNGSWGGNGGMNGGVGSEVQRGFDHSSVVSKLDGITQGICDSTYALNNTMTTGFSNAELSRCNQQSALMQQLFAMQMQNQNCCCETREAIQGVRYDLATQACDTRNTIQNSTRELMENSNANSRAILEALNQNYIRSLESENQSLKLAASQSNQNAVLMAAMDANKAEILRRSGHDCPSAAYIVQPPTPVNFPTNCCGTFTGFGGGCAA